MGVTSGTGTTSGTKSNKAYRGWMLTINNPPCEEWQPFADYLDTHNVRYAKVALEVGEAGNRHFQVYLYFPGKRRFSSVKKLFPSAHIEPRFGTHQQASDYIGQEEKSGTVLWVEEFGVPPKQGGRSDLSESRSAMWDVKDAIDNGASEGELWDDYFPYMVRSYTGVREYIQYTRSKSDGDVEKSLARRRAVNGY